MIDFDEYFEWIEIERSKIKEMVEAMFEAAERDHLDSPLLMPKTNGKT